MRLVTDRFDIDAGTATILSDDHYRSLRKVPVRGMECP
jgi:hypothetical protein